MATTAAGSCAGIFTCNSNIKTQSIKCLVDHFLQKGTIGCTPLLSTPLAADPDHHGEIRERSVLPLKTLRKQIKDGHFDVNEVEAETGVSLLMVLCCKARLDAAKLLLKKGADPTMCDKNGWNSLFYAIWGESIGCIRAILSAGLSSLINTKNDWGTTPLMISMYKCELAVTQLLIKKGGDPFIIDIHQRTLIHWAAMGKQVSSLEYILDKYFPKSSQGSITRYSVDADGASPLHYATIMSGPNMIALLLSEGFSPSANDHSSVTNDVLYPALTEGLTPVHWACVMMSHELASIDKLLNHDDKLVHVLSQQQLTPLHIAACVGSATLCKMLINNGAKVNIVDDSGMSPLHYACLYGHLDCVQLLLEEQADINAMSQRHMCGLHLASQGGHSDVVDYLVRVGGATRDIVSGSGNSAIHLAAINGRSESIKSLLRQGCNVDLLRECDGRSSLHLSAYNGHLDCCRVLINEGAIVNRRDKTVEGCGPLDLAMLANHTDCCDLLLSCDARTHGGKVHRSACTVQLSWRFYVYKRRKRITRDLAARIIQNSVREWLMRQMARRVRKRRERKRLQAAIIIQKWWKEYLIKKKLLLESYNALKAKFECEKFATSLILKELSFNESNIHLPSNKSRATRLRPNHPQSNARYPRSCTCTSSLLRSSIEPIPQFNNEPLVYEQQPALSTAKPQNKKTVRINTVPIITKPTTKISEGQRIDSQTAPIALTRGHSTPQIELPKLMSNGDFSTSSKGVVSTKCANEVTRGTRAARNNSLRLPSINGQQFLTGGGGTSAPVVPNHNRTASHTDDFSLPPIASKPLVSNRLKDRATKNKKGPSKDKKERAEMNSEPRPLMVRPVDESKLLSSTRRFQNLNHVTALLGQAKDIQSITHGEDANYDDLKIQINTALEEAKKLRADTDAIWDDIKSNRQ